MRIDLGKVLGHLFLASVTLATLPEPNKAKMERFPRLNLIPSVRQSCFRPIYLDYLHQALTIVEKGTIRCELVEDQ